MKFKLPLAIAAAALIGPAAFAQANTSPSTTDTTGTTATTPSAAAPTGSATTGTEAMTPAPDAAASSTTTTTTTTADAAPNGVTYANGEYMKDGRKASRSEVAEYKRWAKDNNRPM